MYKLSFVKDYFWKIVVLSVLVLSCTKDEDINPSGSGLPDIGKDAESIPEWIYEEMSFYYFWNDDISKDEPSGDEDPESYFYNLLDNNDIFSFISDDAEAIKEEMTGTILAMGFSSSYGLFSNSNNLFAVVEYVYRDSPAEKAGLKRGDIILKINGERLTNDNYLKLSSNEGFSLGFGEYNGNGIIDANREMNIATGQIELDPVIYSEVMTVDNQKTGYLVFVDFIAGENDKWLKSLGNAIGEMKEEGITQLIMDLRYNPGGEVKVAEYLASAIAPVSVVNSRDVLVRYTYNENLTDHFTGVQGVDSPNLLSRFAPNINNLNLDNVIFLTTHSTASASELVINGLEPYMDVTIVGEPTFGKFYGAFLLFDENDPPKHNWAIAPITLKYANADGVTDFANGLTPDIFLEDDMLHAKDFGDDSDPMLATAIAYLKGEIIDNSSGRIATTRKYEPIYNLKRISRKNVFFIQE